MENINLILNVMTLVVLGIGGFLLSVGRQALEAGVKASAEKGAEVAIKNINWPQELAQELEKVRGVERQEFRFKSYGALWAKLRPLAIYDRAGLGQSTAAGLSKELSDWYFSECGGLMLTQQVREFYFALQDLLRAIADVPDWKAERSSENLRDVFSNVLQKEKLDGAKETLHALAKLGPREWPGVAASLGEKWRKDVEKLAAGWSRLSASEHFAVLQQVGSTLRTSMVNDVESRLR